MRLTSLLCCTSLLALLAMPVLAEPLAPRGEVSVKGGTDRSLLTTEFWAPLAQQSDRVLYGDIRLMGDNDENREGNLGLGYRQIKNDTVLGVHGWIDRRRTQHNSTFHQVTFGVERLGHIVDARANVYIPINNGRTIITPNIGVNSLYLAKSGIYYDTTGQIDETPQYGLDGEVGTRIPVFKKHIDAIRVYGGGYYFFRDNTVEVPGIRFRSEAQVNKAFAIGARVQYDKPRGTQGFLEATLKFPFSAKRLYQESGIRSRLDESPERDVDIVTDTKIDTGLFKPVINTATGTQQRILYVDNSKTDGGDGSYEKPFNNLKAAESALRAHDILYINRGDGTTHNMDQGITISKANVQLIGSGSALSYGGTTLLGAGAPPVLTNTQNRADEYTGNGITIFADNTLVSGITISGASGHGVYAEADHVQWNALTVRNTNVTGVTWYGIYASILNGSSIRNVTFENTSASNSLSRYGYAVRVTSGSHVENITIRNNTATGNVGIGHGIQLMSTGNSVIDHALIENNRSANNQGYGIFAVSSVSSVIKNLEIKNNITNNNTMAGIHVNADSSQINAMTISGNEIYSNNSSGMDIYANTAGTINNAVIANNNSYNNTGGVGNGFYLRIANGSTLSAVLSGNSASGNAQNGYRLYALGNTGAYNVSMYNNNAFNNTVNGVLVDNDAAAAVTYNVDLGGGSLNSLGGNRIYNNTSRDVYVDTVPLTGSGTLVHARNNWWGVNTGLAVGRRTLEGTSTIDSTAFLTTDPRP